ncbi:hypothetical protein LINPERHAP1_LOCUS4545 [Linum perenne]
MDWKVIFMMNIVGGSMVRSTFLEPNILGITAAISAIWVGSNSCWE